MAEDPKKRRSADLLQAEVMVAQAKIARGELLSPRESALLSVLPPSLYGKGLGFGEKAMPKFGTAQLKAIADIGLSIGKVGGRLGKGAKPGRADKKADATAKADVAGTDTVSDAARSATVNSLMPKEGMDADVAQPASTPNRTINMEAAKAALGPATEAGAGADMTGAEKEKKMPTDELAGDGEFGVEDGISAGLNLAKVIAGAVGASKPLPDYKLPVEWDMYRNRLKAMSEQGLDPASRALAEQGIAQNFATTMQSARNITGGGGSASEAAANSIEAGMRQNTSRLQLAQLDNNVRQQNIGLYGNALQTDILTDKQNFARDYNEAAQSQNAYATLASQGVQALAELPYANQNDDLWRQVLQSVAERNQEASAATRARNRQGAAQFVN